MSCLHWIFTIEAGASVKQRSYGILHITAAQVAMIFFSEPQAAGHEYAHVIGKYGAPSSAIGLAMGSRRNGKLRCETQKKTGIGMMLHEGSIVAAALY